MSIDDIQVTGQDRNVKDSFFARFCGENHDLAESRENLGRAGTIGNEALSQRRSF